jgi:hypothetical protein
MKPAKHYHLHGESGQAIIATALCVACLVGFVGFAVNLGQLLRAKTNLQKVADAAALAGAAEYVSGGLSRATLAAQASALQNGINCSATGITCPVSIGTTAHPQAVSVYISQPQSTYLAGVFGYPTINVGARAAAGITSGQVCMYSLENAKTAFGGDGFLIHGGGKQTGIYAPQCSIYDNANLTVTGSHNLITAASIGVVGTATPQNSCCTPQAVTGLLPVPDPLAGYWTIPPCTSNYGNQTYNSGQVPYGCYNDLTVGVGATLQGGLYVIQGKLNMSVASATNVTIYVDSANGGSASCNGNGCNTITGSLSAPPLGTGTTGTCTFAAGCNGLVFWDTETTSHPQTVGIGFTSVTGIIYAPKATLQLNGNTVATFTTDIVAGAYLLNGDINMTNYSATAGAASPFNSATLLE